MSNRTAKFFKRMFNCQLLDRPVVAYPIATGPRKGVGDYGDQWSKCALCGQVIHRDIHMYGDAVWRHYDETE